jgi:cellulose synthase/poly-beta-1,6-N-acetylglucosamine synthase-like glycosyltransferase
MALQAATVSGFTLGICASDAAPDLPRLLSFLETEEFGESFALLRIIIVASGCTEETIREVRRAASEDARVHTIVEDRRRGKAQAINQILERSRGEFLVMLNADAFPERDSIRKLLDLANDKSVGAASAEPIFEAGDGPLQRALSLMWSSHSLMSLSLNHAGISNHACDELIVVRRSLFTSLPPNLVNDGAYIGGLVRRKGYSVKFSVSARVKIAVPKVPIDLIRQRRRIIFGHVQVWKNLGRPPMTIESMLFMDPLVSLRTILRTLSKRPRLILGFPLVAVSESIAILTGLWDVASSSERHAVWRRNAE